MGGVHQKQIHVEIGASQLKLAKSTK